jgi:hypothetical protein
MGVKNPDKMALKEEKLRNSVKFSDKGNEKQNKSYIGDMQK